MIVTVGGTETTTGTDLAIVIGITIETVEEELEEIRIAHQGRKKDVWVEMHTVALAQERARRAPSSSKAEVI